jgi:hypothetical protein
LLCGSRPGSSEAKLSPAENGGGDDEASAKGDGAKGCGALGDSAAELPEGTSTGWLGEAAIPDGGPEGKSRTAAGVVFGTGPADD